ncbi:ribosome recycling factor [Candidatus Roizmanbacteria bacterium CG_4_8_14_3_um_filter_36_10]|uniref:Ribosome recycling factor n=1 Tax=Candidatus Roizmanbacteria bacterium CG_4_8_14_3_um_filter_36_10 TaxID=1974834 RepID=A0A2M8GMS0_9BACT|nr:MAG: ribosome recycling factor [Candidatus Roizmanbacteria bacterium CG_4_8_14_3_um_filter_36_10]
MDLISQFQTNCQKVIAFLKEDLKSIHTGRANPALVENLVVEAYSGQSKLKLFELATITTEGPAILVVIPFDPSIIKDVEKAILKSPLNITPQTQGNRIVLRLSALSTEQREKLIKFISQKVEEKKTSIRNFRDEVRKKIKNSFEAKETTEDEKFRLEKEIDKLTQKYTKEVEIIKENKEKEIAEI